MKKMIVGPWRLIWALTAIILVVVIAIIVSVYVALIVGVIGMIIYIVQYIRQQNRRQRPVDLYSRARSRTSRRRSKGRKLPPIYQTWWFYCLAFAGLFFVIALLTPDKKAPETMATNQDSSSKVHHNNDVTKIPDKTTKQETFSYENSIYQTDSLRFKLTDASVQNGYEGTKVLVVLYEVTNLSKHDKIPMVEFAMYTQAKQPDGASKIALESGTLENGDIYKEQQDAITQDLAPKKTVSGISIYELKNNNPVTLEFQNGIFKKVGTKTYEL